MKSKFGVSAANLNMAYPEHKNMAAKLVWQHYRQALDKEGNVSSFQPIWLKIVNLVTK